MKSEKEVEKGGREKGRDKEGMWIVHRNDKKEVGLEREQVRKRARQRNGQISK